MIQKSLTFNNNKSKSLCSSPRRGMNKLKKYYCKVCNKNAKYYCKECKKAFYCNELCQKNDWPLHKYKCNLNNSIHIPYEKNISRLTILKIIILNKGDRIDHCKDIIKNYEQIIFNIFSVVYDKKNTYDNYLMSTSSYLNIILLLKEHLLNYFLLINFLYGLEKKNREVAFNIFLHMICKFEKYFDLIIQDLPIYIKNEKKNNIFNTNIKIMLSLLQIFALFFNFSIKFNRISAQRKFLVKYLKVIDLIFIIMKNNKTIFIRDNLLLYFAYFNINKYNPLKSTIVCLESIICPFSNFYEPFNEYKYNFKLELISLYNLSLILYVNGENQKALTLLNEGEYILDFRKDEIEDEESEIILEDFKDFYYHIMKKFCILETEILIDSEKYEFAYKKIIEALKYLKLGFNRKKLVTFNKKENYFIEKNFNDNELKDKKFICFFFDIIVRKVKTMKNFQNFDISDLKTCFNEIYNSSVTFNEDIEDINNVYENNLRNFIQSEKKNLFEFGKKKKKDKFPSFSLNLNYIYNTLDNSYNDFQILSLSKKIKKENNFKEEVNFFSPKKTKNVEIIDSNEMNKFFIFICQLNNYQIHILNKTQPKISNNKFINSLPIYFSNQFLDILSFEQRLLLYEIKSLTLLRYIILNQPEKEINVNNLNFTLIKLKERTLVSNNSSLESSIDYSNVKNNNKEFKKFFKKILYYDEQFAKENYKEFNKIYNNLNKKDIKEIIENPSIIYDVIKNHIKNLKKKENKKNNQKKKNFNNSYEDNINNLEEKRNNKTIIYDN